jgi:putative sterol carrier protein
MWIANELDYEGTLRNFQQLFNNNPRVKKLIKNWERTILLSATDTGSKYSLVVKADEMTEVRKALPAEEDEGDGLVHLQAEESILKQIFSGKYNPATALLDGALAVFSQERDKVKLEALAMIIWRLG